MDDDMRLIAVRVSATGGYRNFELVYRLENGGYAQYAWTDCPGQEERWVMISGRQLKNWMSANRSQIVEVRAAGARSTFQE